MNDETEECRLCYGKGYVHAWVEDPTSSLGGYEGPEMYCSCETGQELKKRE